MLPILLVVLSLIGSFCSANSWRTCQPDRVFIAPEYQSYHWKGHDGDITTDQSLYGGIAGYEHWAPEKLYFRGWGRFDLGKTNNQDFFSHDWRLEGDVGYTWAFGACCKWLVTPFLGLGSFLEHHAHYNATHRHETEIYVPVGLLLGWDITGAWSTALRAQANIQIHRSSIAQGVSGSLMSKKTDWVAELPITYRFWCSALDLSLVPEFAWNPNSSAEGSPWGQQTIWGVRLELGYRW